MIFLKHFATSAILALNFAGSSFAQERISPTECAHALIPDTVVFNRDYERSLSLLSVLNESNFEQEEHKFDWNSAAVAFGVPFVSDMSYSGFDQRRQETYQRFQVTDEISEIVRFTSSQLGANSLAAYQSCLEAVVNISNRYGFHAWIGEFDDEIIAVHVRWNLPPGVTGPANVEVRFPRNVEPIVGPDIPLVDGSTGVFLFETPTNESDGSVDNFRVIITGGGETYDMTVLGDLVYVPPCDLSHANDGLAFRQYHGGVHERICNRCSDCREQSFSRFEVIQLDLACLWNVQPTTIHAIDPRNFDCSWQVGPTPIVSLSYGPPHQQRTINVARDRPCEALRQTMTELEIEVPAAFCR